MSETSKGGPSGGTPEERPGFGRDRTTENDDGLRGNTQERLDEKLDEALEETFPDSDPVSVKITK